MYQNQNFRRQNNRGGYRGNYRNENYQRGRSRSRERQYQGSIRKNDRGSSSRSRSESGVSINRDRTRHYKFREYNHFAKDCSTIKIEETNQIQQIFNLDKMQASLKPLATDTYDSLNCVGFIRGNKIRIFKLIEGKNGLTTFLPLNTNIGGHIKPNRNKENRYLMEDQAKHIIKKVELGSMINVSTIKQEIDQD